MERIILIYEPKQVTALERYLASERDRDGLTVVALGADLEYELERKGISFESGRGLRRLAHFENLSKAEALATEIFSDPAFKFFSYREVALPRIFVTVLQEYLMHLFYFTDVLETLLSTRPECNELILLAHPYLPLETDGVLAPLDAVAAVTAARIVAGARGVACELPYVEAKDSTVREWVRAQLFYVTRGIFGLALSVFNRMVTLFVRPRPLRILASDNWNNLKTLMDQLPEAELTLLDRAQARRAGMRAILAHRMRFVHVQSFAGWRESSSAVRYVREFGERWEEVSKELSALREVTLRGHSLTDAVTEALEAIMGRGAGRAIALIDGAYAAYARMQPSIVLVRANLSAQIHFPILCYVARNMGIPSIEVQHGLIYVGSRTGDMLSAVEYVATYGRQTNEEFRRVGYTSDKTFGVGSPRFDVYPEMRERSRVRPAGKRLTVMAPVPAILPESWSDSYEVLDYLTSLAEAVRQIPEARILLKLRPDRHHERFYRNAIGRIFKGLDFEIRQYEPIVEVFEEADIVISIYSTTMLEGLISGRPVIYNGILEFHRELGKSLADYEKSGALIVVGTQDGLEQALRSLVEPERRAEVVGRADAFMSERYAFDGKASERLARAVRDLAARRT